MTHYVSPCIWPADNQDGTYRNPVIHADYSDPDAICVNGRYYMVASSFNHLPGLPILESSDLVNWRIINHVLPTLPKQFDEVLPGKGVWAPSLRFHDGYFWVFYSMPDEGIFMSKAQDPYGEWSAAHCLKAVQGWIDPCPLWDDDGRAWLVHAFAYSRANIKHKLQLCAMSPDGRSLLDEGKIIFDGTRSHPTLEGPKFYKRNGEYYIFAPAGGVESGWQTVLRSRTVEGQYLAKNVLHQGVTGVNGPHQGGWVESPDGEGWFVHFQDKGFYGRIVHVQPLRWDDEGWPQIGALDSLSAMGEPVMRARKPAGSAQAAYCEPQTSDDFVDGKPGLQWQWPANPQPGWIIPGQQGLTLACYPVGPHSLYDTPQLLLQKFPAPAFSAQTTLTADFIHQNDEAGLVIYGERFASVALVWQNGNAHLKVTTGWNSDKGIVDFTSELLPVRASMSRISLRVAVDNDGICQFSWSQHGESWQLITPDFAASAGKWIGAKVGIYALSSADYAVKGRACFAHFTVTATSPPPYSRR
ncbi:glycoside hydrolase 43 family protein [Enterobacter sp. Bisph1]|uniref:glycoside hydrolase family 43 protein n=1 Tax=Enterobacter sp. Bisph1 TaxID=1274399 RepID=UPI00068C9999|nr:glycoside hydrolase 43 family protein [Enterobacter sp. Bisph1]